MTTFHLIRHGDTPAVGKFIAGRAAGVHLTDAGRRQVEELAARLDGEPIRAVYASPLERAVQTAEPLARRFGVAVRTADDLTEFDFGDWTGKTFAELDPLPEWRRFNAFRSGTPAPGGESMLDVQRRVVGLMQQLGDEHPDEAVALVSHGDVIRAALLYHLGMPLDHYARLEISTAGVSVVDVGGYGPVVRVVNQTGP